MKATAIPADALDRFRRAATMRTQSPHPRASRLLIVREEIASLRKHGISYRSISELLTQNGIPISNVTVMKFCHRFLNEKRQRKLSATLRQANHAKPATQPKSAPMIPGKTAITSPTESSSFTTREPRIAKVEQLPPGETI